MATEIKDLTDIQSQVKSLLEARQKDLDELDAKRIMLRAELTSLQRAVSALDKVETAQPTPKPQRTRNGEESRASQVVNALRASEKSLDLGALAKAIGLEDNAQNRTKINATLTPLLKGHDSPVVRVTQGVYAARIIGEVRM